MQEQKDVLKVEGRFDKGYGYISKAVMQDRTISALAKAIYSYFCSFAGNGVTAFPSRSKIISDLRVSKDTFYKHFNQLLEKGYIKVEQKKENGRFSKNVYTLVENVPATDSEDESNIVSDSNDKIENRVQNNDILPCPKISDTVKAKAAEKLTYNNNLNLPCHTLPDTIKPDSKNNNNKKDINNIYNNQSINQSTGDGWIVITESSSSTEDRKVDNIQDFYNQKMELVKEELVEQALDDCPDDCSEQVKEAANEEMRKLPFEGQYSCCVSFKAQQMVEEIHNLFVDVSMSQRPLRINGESKNIEIVKSSFAKLTARQIVCVINTALDIDFRKIYNPRHYMISMLYNASMSSSLYTAIA